MALESVIGLEIHVVLSTAQKLFCACSTAKNASPNTQVCPVCLGQPEAVPCLNFAAVEKAIAAALALHCQIQSPCHFDRKHYVYPDLPKGYQITQDERPLGFNGRLDQVRINRVHLEEDAGKLVHVNGETIADFNRAGLPLIEIVTEPDLRSPEETADFMKKLRDLLVNAGVTNGLMHEGSFRCDVNVSLHEESTPYGTRVEIKNLNSFKFVKKAIHVEIARQKAILEAGESITQQTRRYDEKKNETFFMRQKEAHEDYHFQREPNIPDVIITNEEIKSIGAALPTL